jgi:hypothetical protein
MLTGDGYSPDILLKRSKIIESSHPIHNLFKTTVPTRLMWVSEHNNYLFHSRASLAQAEPKKLWGPPLNIWGKQQPWSSCNLQEEHIQAVTPKLLIPVTPEV